MTLRADISAVANRMILLSSALERARRVVIRTYQVYGYCVTPNGRGDIVDQKIIYFHEKSIKKST